MNFNNKSTVALPITVAVSLVGVAGAMLAGCATVESDVSAAPLPGIEDFPPPAAADYNVNLKLGNELIDNRLMSLESPPKVTFTVWGFDELAADVSATELKVSEFELRPQSVPYFLRFGEADLQLIEFRSGDADSLKYYITMGVDVDGDGRICNGDFRQDYSLSQPERFSVNETEVDREIRISEINGEICSE